MICMMYFEEATDAYEYIEPSGIVDCGGPHWVYCLKCDCWTEHPEEGKEGE